MVSERRGLGEAVDLDELPAELGLDALDGLGRRRRPRDDHAHAPAAGHRRALVAARRCRVEHGGDHRGRAVEERHALGVHAAQDLLAVDLPDDDVAHPHACDRVRHAPAIAVKRRQGVEIHVAVGHRQVPPERDRVQPEVAVGELRALGPRRRPRGVIDRDRRVFDP